MSVKRRLEKLEARAQSDANDVADVVMLVSAGTVQEMTPDQWRRWRREHPDRCILTVREYVE